MTPEEAIVELDEKASLLAQAAISYVYYFILSPYGTELLNQRPTFGELRQ